jgi:IPT/TIG domain
MPEWPDELLSGADQPRPLPPALRRRLEERLLAGADAPKPLDPDLSARLAEDLSDPVAPLLADVDRARELPPALRQRLERRLVGPPRGRQILAIAAVVVVLGGVGLAITRLTRPSSSPPATASGPTTTSSPDLRATAGAGGPGATGSVGGSAGHPVAGQNQPAVAEAPSSATSAVLPPTGPAAGGNSVVIDGTGFTGASVVKFGDTPATRFVVVSDSRLQAVVPAHSPGEVTVTVITGAGPHLAGRYVYLP